MKTVSIITPCYNAERFVQLTYKSLQNQSFHNWEWIVTNDNSSDNTLEILTRMSEKDSRVKVFNHDKNMGAAIARNTSLNHATGEYVAFLDVDDLWDQEKLKIQISFMEKENISFSYHHYNIVTDDGEVIKMQQVPLKYTSQDLLKFNPFATSSIMIKATVINSHNIRFKEHLRRRQDYIFWYDVLKHLQNAKAINDVLSSYRLVGDSSLSANKKKMAIIQWKILKDEFNVNFLLRIYYFLCYANHGIKKYFFK